MLFLASCKTASVSVEYNPQVNFDGFKSYRWIDNKETASYNSLQRQRLKKEIEVELSKKGMVLVTSEADLFVDLKHTKSQKVLVTTPRHNFHYYPYNYWGSIDYQTSIINENEMSLVLVDTKTNNAIWEGSIVDWRFDIKTTDEIKRLVHALLENFPPRK